MNRLLVVAIATAAFTTTSAFADDAPPTPTTSAGGPVAKAQLVIGDTGDRPPGWTPGLQIGGTFNLLDSRNVVGQQDGTAVSLGAALDSEIDFNQKIHEWRTTLKAAAGATRTPSLPEFVKTTDSLDFESIYLAHLIEQFGPFARVAFDTSMFPSLDIRSAPVNYLVSNVDGTTTAYTGRRLALTSAFTPATFKESIGAFTQPVKNDHITFEGRLGVGAQETIAKNQLAINDDATTADVIEVKELSNFYQIGAEGVANAWGTIDNDKRVSYTVGVAVLVPFAHTTDLPKGDDRNAGDLTNVEAHAGLNVRIFDWASLDYKLAVLRQPLLVDDVQVSNVLLLTLGAAWGSKAPKPPPPPPPCDCSKPPPGEAAPAAVTPPTTAPAAAPGATMPEPAKPAEAPAPANP